jgi:hypothetical protein
VKIAIVYDAVYPYVKGGAERRYYELARRLAAGARSSKPSSLAWPAFGCSAVVTT